MSATSTVRLGAGQASRLRVRGFQLEVRSGREAVRVERFTAPVVRIGSGEDCDLVLADPTVSRAHLAIEDRPDGHWVKDLGSTNGTQLGGTAVREALLKPGAVLALGGTQLTFEPLDHEIPVLPVSGSRYHGLVGESRAMKELFAHLEMVAATPLTLVLLGETGCGKEMAARALHDASPRAAGPFTVFDCGAVDRELVGTALFGHQEGAFTGATAARKGAFQSAHGGTLFLDEIGELPLDVQPRLLRVLERREVQPVGSDKLIPVDVRLVAATHRDLEAMADKGTFRRDLLFRLSGLVVELPPLRERREDVAPLARAMLAQIRPDAAFTPAAIARLEAHGWPGNVRELKNVVERAAAMTRGPVLDAAEVLLGPVRLGRAPDAPAAAPASPPGSTISLNEAELLALRTALKASGGNKSKAARMLGIARKTLRDKMERYGLSSGPDED